LRRASTVRERSSGATTMSRVVCTRREFTIPPEEARKIWVELDKKAIGRAGLGMEPEGDFKSIGVSWKGADSTYGVSYIYNEIPRGSPLASVLKIVQRNGLDTWRIPKQRSR
jgi:hypothetical protein